MNHYKTTPYPIKVNNITAQVMADSINCRLDKFPCKYLGLPVGVNMNIIRNWNCVVDCFKRRLSKWKAKKLSFGGSRGCHGQVGSFKTEIFLGGDEDKAKTNWVAWDRVIGPCDKGGLGLGSLKDLNDGLLAKWWWRYKTEKGSVWRNVIDAIHFNQNSWGYLPIKKGISGSWNMINKLEKEFAIRNLNIRSLIKGSCGNGLDIRFWVDWWVGEGPLMECYPALFALEKQKAVLIAEQLAGWDWRRSPFSVQEMVELQGCSTLVSSIVLLPTADRWCWPSSPEGSFSVGQCRKLLAKYAVPFYPFSWFKWVPRKVSVFAWRAEQDRLPTYNGLKRRRILSGSSLCRVCGDGEEDAAHLFNSCAAAALLWQQISSWCRIPPVYAHTVRDLFDVHNHIGCSAGKKDLIKMIILAGTWTIWKMRNEVIFQGKHVNLQGLFGEVQAITFAWVKHKAKKRSGLGSCGGLSTLQQHDHNSLCVSLIRRCLR